MKNLRIVSYNITYGREIIDYDMKKIADDILELNPDIVGLQEVDRFAKRTNFMDTIKLLSKYTGYPYILKETVQLIEPKVNMALQFSQNIQLEKMNPIC